MGDKAKSMSGAVRVRRSGGFELPCGGDRALPYFSPEGEREWVTGWDPKPVFPEAIEFRRDTVFIEGPAGKEAIWTIVDADFAKRRAEYVRVAADSHAAHIVVQIEELARERSRVLVSYVVTAFGEDKSILEGFSELGYAQKMHEWRRRIETCLESRQSILTEADGIR
jgi:hypothetical protein